MFPPEFNPTSGMHRILVVDDEEMVLKGLRDTLAREGYNVVTSSNPFLALEELKTQNFSVIISDQHMPGMLGMQFLAQARDIQSNASRRQCSSAIILSPPRRSWRHDERRGPFFGSSVNAASAPGICGTAPHLVSPAHERW